MTAETGSSGLASTATKAIAGGGSVAIVSLVIGLHYQVMESVQRIETELGRIGNLIPTITENVSALSRDVANIANLSNTRYSEFHEARTELRYKLADLDRSISILQQATRSFIPFQSEPQSTSRGAPLDPPQRMEGPINGR